MKQAVKELQVFRITARDPGYITRLNQFAITREKIEEGPRGHSRKLAAKFIHNALILRKNHR